MNKEPQVLKLFIPAKSLEHPSNGEMFTLNQKLCAAVNRYIHNGNFEDITTSEDQIPYIFIQNQEFDKKLFGYFIEAKVTYISA